MAALVRIAPDFRAVQPSVVARCRAQRSDACCSLGISLRDNRTRRSARRRVQATAVPQVPESRACACSTPRRFDRWGMKPSDEPIRLDEDEPPKRSRSEEALRIIEEYADQLREIIRKFRRRLH